jgi:cytidine deaminase
LSIIAILATIISKKLKPQQKKIEIKYKEFSSIKDLETIDRELLIKAEEARLKAYAPYSKFKVGAAVLLKNGLVVTGNNQENIAYPSGLCAERVALFSASSKYNNIEIDAIAIAGKVKNKNIVSPVTPCGSCRQVMIEYEKIYGKNIKVIMGSSESNVYIVSSIADLLPLSFFAEILKK